MPRDVFISYSSQDAVIAKTLCKTFESAGISCWMAPRDLPIGATYATELFRAIDSAHAVALIFSTVANASPHIATEIDRAFSRGKPIFTFCTEDVMPKGDLEYYLARHQRMNGFPPPLEERAIRLAEAIKSFLGRGAPGVAHEMTPIAAANKPQTANGRVFDENGRLRVAEFAFPLSSVLLRAAKRRNNQKRERASLLDFLAGLIRVGGLTRFVLKRADRAPDELYDKLQLWVSEAEAAAKDAAPPGIDRATDPDKEEVESRLERWVLSKRDDFDPELADLLEASSTGASQQITELRVLEKLLGSAAWECCDISLPAMSVVRHILDERQRTNEVDENGEVPLNDLTAEAREVVLHAHSLARHCQSVEISHRLLMAAFVSEGEQRYASGLCRSAGVNTKMLWAMLVCISRKEADAPAADTDACLTPAVCERVVAPMLKKARDLAEDPKAVSEAELFRAFCLTANRGFVEFLRTPAEGEVFEAMEIDLMEICNLTYGSHESRDVFARLTLRARDVVRLAHRLAREVGMFPIPNRIVLAAFLGGPKAIASQLLKASGVDAVALNEVLIEASKGGKPMDFELDDKACQRVIGPMIERAHELAGAEGLVTERLLFQAYCDVAAADFKKSLKSAGVNLDLLRGGDMKKNPATRKDGDVANSPPGSRLNPHGLN